MWQGESKDGIITQTERKLETVQVIMYQKACFASMGRNQSKFIHFLFVKSREYHP